MHPNLSAIGRSVAMVFAGGTAVTGQKIAARKFDCALLLECTSETSGSVGIAFADLNRDTGTDIIWFSGPPR